MNTYLQAWSEVAKLRLSDLGIFDLGLNFDVDLGVECPRLTSLLAKSTFHDTYSTLRHLIPSSDTQCKDARL